MSHRLIDLLLERTPQPFTGWNPPDSERGEELRSLADDLLAAEAFVVDNVVAYWRQTHHASDAIDWTDFPNLAPPFGRFWIEGPLAMDTEDPDRRYGAIFRVEDKTPDEGGWYIHATTYLGGRDYLVGPMGRVVLEVASDGSFRDTFFLTRDEAAQRDPEVIAPIVTFLGPLLLAISLLHCKNVSTERILTPPAVTRARRRKGKRSLVTYHVLRIEPMREILRREGHAEAKGLKHALHVCRGHFKTFGSDKPLFGRISGTFWWADQVRGRSDLGIRLKDYEVIAPKTAHGLAEPDHTIGKSQT